MLQNGECFAPSSVHYTERKICTPEGLRGARCCGTQRRAPVQELRETESAAVFQQAHPRPATQPAALYLVIVVGNEHSAVGCAQMRVRVTAFDVEQQPPRCPALAMAVFARNAGSATNENKKGLFCFVLFLFVCFVLFLFSGSRCP